RFLQTLRAARSHRRTLPMAFARRHGVLGGLCDHGGAFRRQARLVDRGGQQGRFVLLRADPGGVPARLHGAALARVRRLLGALGRRGVRPGRRVLQLDLVALLQRRRGARRAGGRDRDLRPRAGQARQRLTKLKTTGVPVVGIRTKWNGWKRPNWSADILLGTPRSLTVTSRHPGRCSTRTISTSTTPRPSPAATATTMSLPKSIAGGPGAGFRGSPSRFHRAFDSGSARTTRSLFSLRLPITPRTTRCN